MTQQTISIKETRAQLSRLVEEVAIAKKRFIITKFGKPKAMMIPTGLKEIQITRGVNLAGFGMWKGRQDMKDSAKWVTNIRKQWSLRNKKA